MWFLIITSSAAVQVAGELAELQTVTAQQAARLAQLTQQLQQGQEELAASRAQQDATQQQLQQREAELAGQVGLQAAADSRQSDFLQSHELTRDVINVDDKYRLRHMCAAADAHPACQHSLSTTNTSSLVCHFRYHPQNRHALLAAALRRSRSWSSWLRRCRTRRRPAATCAGSCWPRRLR